MPLRRMELAVWLVLGTNLVAASASYGADLHLVVFADDVVYFIYTGHGVNLGDVQWPTFTFSNGDLFGFEEVLTTLALKPQRLLIVMADCRDNAATISSTSEGGRRTRSLPHRTRGLRPTSRACS